MTISTTDNTISFLGNGVTTIFDFSFRVDDADELEVTLLTVASNQESDPIDHAFLTITLDGQDGGSVEYTLDGDPLTSEYKINLRRVVPYTQDLDLTNQGSSFPESNEEQLDRIVMMIQQVAELAGRSVQIPLGSSQDPQELIDAIVNLALDLPLTPEMGGTGGPDGALTSWTPGIQFGGAAVGMTGSFIGAWNKLGRWIFATYSITLTNKGSSTGNATLTGLPEEVSVGSGALVRAYGNMASLTAGGAIWLDEQTGAQNAKIVTGGTTGSVQLTHANFTNTSSIFGVSIYRAV